MRNARKLVLLGSLLALLGVLLAGCGGGGKQSVPQGAVAVVGKQTITKAQLDSLMQQAEASYKSQKKPFPKTGTPEYAQLQSQAVSYLVQNAEFDQKAKTMGITITPKEIQSQIDQIKQQCCGGKEANYQKQLAKQGITDAQVHDYVRTQILSQDLFTKVTSGVKVSDAEVSAYYKSHLQQFKQPESRDVRHILVKTRATAQKLYQQLQNGADFAALAKRYSLDPGSKSVGGKYTAVKGQDVAPFDRVAFSLKKNEISKPVHTQYGWHIIQALSDVKPPSTTPLSKVKSQIQAQLLQQKQSQTMTQWVAKVQKEYASEVAYGSGYNAAAAVTGGAATSTTATGSTTATTSTGKTTSTTSTTSTGKTGR